MKTIPEFLKEFSDYLRDIEALHRKSKIEQKKMESAKMKTFFSFLERVTGLKPEEYSYDAFIVKSSRPDAVTGNVVVEFEDDLSLISEIREAEEQLKKYIRDLYAKEPRKYWGIASDGLIFRLYKATMQDGEVVLELIDEFNIRRIDPKKFYWFLYEYFYEQHFIQPIRPDMFVLRFGYGSRVYNETLELLRGLWDRIKDKTEVKVFFDEWAKYFTYVTGKEQYDEELFLRHTYLAILTKLLTYIYLEGEKVSLGDLRKLQHVLTGKYFEELGLEIFERDFYSWVLNEDIVEEFLWGLHEHLLKELLTLDYSTLNTDILKEIYQNIIERDERAALGEYYTPDFIAEKILRELLRENPEGKILDPACGSGTFLFIAIKLKKELLQNKKSKRELLNHVINSVVGLDINPLAVILARANYLIAIRDLLPAKGRLRIPVYLANAILIPEKEKDTVYFSELNKSVEVYRIPGLKEGEFFLLPGQKLLAKLGFRGIDTFIVLSEDAVKTFSNEIKECQENYTRCREELSQKLFVKYITKYFSTLPKEEQEILASLLSHNVLLLHKYIEERKNSFWIFILRNIYKPLLFRKEFDFVVGNPPWVSYSDVESEKFRSWFDSLLGIYEIKFDMIYKGRADTTQLFILHSINYYLKNKGYLYFVIPSSFLYGYQYEALREESGLVKIYKIVDLRKVKINRKDIFNVPCILALFRKEKKKEKEVIDGEVYEGNIEYQSRNVSYEYFNKLVESAVIRRKVGVFRKAMRNILSFSEEAEEKQLVDELVSISRIKRSPYLKQAKEGSNAVPRNFIFAIIPRPKYGFDPEKVYVETHPRALERKGVGVGKEKYMQKLKGIVSSKYLYGIVTADNIYPFGVWGINIAVVPATVDEDANRFSILSAENAYNELKDWYDGGLKQYFIDNEGRKPTREDKIKFLRWLINNRINYVRSLTDQNPRAYTVVYNRAGDALLLGSAVLNRRKILRYANEKLNELLGINKGTYLFKAIIVDYTNYWLDFESEEEAHYVCAMLQSTPVREATARLQTVGVKGRRDIHDRPFFIPIPRYGEISELADLQKELAVISKKLHVEVFNILKEELEVKRGIPFVNNTRRYLAPATVASIRRAVRKHIEEQQVEIDYLATEILKHVVERHQSNNLLKFLKHK